MKREIKFRAWIPDTGWLADGFSIAMDGTEWYDDNGHSWQLSQLELMQYTGLKDKNGVEIYEGDILRDNNGTLVIIKFRYGCFFACLPYDDGAVMTANACDFHNLISQWECANDKIFTGSISLKVIGNIYENPDLLTSPK